MLVLDDRQVPFVLRVSARAQSLRLVIGPERGLEVVMPKGTPETQVERVLAEKKAWIARTLDRVAHEHAAATSQPIVDGRILPLAGRRLRLVLALGAPAGRYRARPLGESLLLTVHDSGQETVRRALEGWYRQQAQVVFAERLAAGNAAYGFTYGRVSIKEQKSRWGSCSRRGNLNFNWRLVLAPLAVLDYVVVHELCHLKEMNHSKRFWRLVARACPDYAVHRRWLQQHGHTLRL